MFPRPVDHPPSHNLFFKLIPINPSPADARLHPHPITPSHARTYPHPGTHTHAHAHAALRPETAGSQAVADYVHSKGLQFGIYTDRGQQTCTGRPGSLGYEATDASTYAAWGVDYVKEDSCNATSNHSQAFAEYARMRDALNATGRRMYFDLCGWSPWYAPEGAALGNAWRVGYDVNTWEGVYHNALMVDQNLAAYAGPGGWNDIDALIGSVPTAAVYLTPTQSRTQFNLWCMLCAQLVIGGNILDMSAWDLETYSNTALIALNQDPAGRQAELVLHLCAAPAAPPLGSAAAAVPPCTQVWLKALSTGEYAMAFVNFTSSSSGGAARPPSPGGSHAVASAAAAAAPAGTLAVLPCNEAWPSQRWNVTEGASGLATIGSAHRADAPGPGPANDWCLEVNGCNYAVGGQVDAAYACKPLPPAGNRDKCAANMAWHVNGNGTVSAAWNTSLCLVVRDGGRLALCDGSPSQRWVTAGGAGQPRQIVSGNGFGCLTNGHPPGGPPATLEFDVAAFGWSAATFTNLWSNSSTTGVGFRALACPPAPRRKRWPREPPAVRPIAALP